MLRVFTSDHIEVPLPAGHRFPMQKYALLRQALLAWGVLEPAELIEAPLASRAELLRAHTEGWVAAIFDGTLSRAEERRIGLPWSEALLLRSRASVGGTIAAARAALEEGVAGNLAGGTHHAAADHGEGYCVFNDLAVAIRTLEHEGRIRRALVIDLDVHQGNGTASIFAGDPNVFTFSMHGERNFPFRKVSSSMDVGLPDGTKDAEYLEVLDRHLSDVIDAANPDLVLYQAGVDPLAADKLGRLSLTHEGLRERDRRVLEIAKERRVPVVLTLGGGYADPIIASIDAHAGTYRAVLEVYAFRDPPKD